jgi:AraC family transcriptional regulator, regulatory protein of adaptative response / methylated-DNA-[protein]-cysteine methyltransferase
VENIHVNRTVCNTETDASDFSQAAMDYQRVEAALRFLSAHFLEHPSLSEVASHVHLSEYHFERLFQRWAGTSPKRFLQFLTKEHARSLLLQSATLLETTMASGLTSSGRLHDLFVTCEAVTPGEWKNGGQGLTIRYGMHPTSFGSCFLALSDRGICALVFADLASELENIRQQWPQARFVEDNLKTGEVCGQIFRRSSADQPPLPLHIRGTNFQLKVWQALLTIPAGKLVSYGQIANLVGCPAAHRAVGTAVGKNQISILIPCHRVIHSLGTFGNYRWGSARKQALIGWEASCAETPIY